jgi:putative PIN family toxin of toxin-antitoxin system
VLLQAAVSRGPAFAALTLADTGHLELLLSREIISELSDVLFRPAVRQKFPILTDEYVNLFIDRLERMGSRIDPVPARIHYPRDPDDEPYLNLAIHGDAEYLITRDRNLLDLATPASAEARDFRQRCPRLGILDPVELNCSVLSSPNWNEHPIR